MSGILGVVLIDLPSDVLHECLQLLWGVGMLPIRASNNYLVLVFSI